MHPLPYPLLLLLLPLLLPCRALSLSCPTGLSIRPLPLVNLTTPSGAFLCTAALIHPRWLLSSRLCPINTRTRASLPANVSQIDAVFQPPTLPVSLLRLSLPLLAAPLPLNFDPALPSPGSLARAASARPIDLVVPVLFPRQCDSARYGDDVMFSRGSMICAAADDCDYCSGDLGGPLVQYSASGIPVLIGIIHVSNGCGDISRPGIYTRTSALQEFLEDQRETNNARFQQFRGALLQVTPDPSPSPSLTPTPSIIGSNVPTAAPSRQARPSPVMSQPPLEKGASDGSETRWIGLAVSVAFIACMFGALLKHRFGEDGPEHVE